MEMGRITLRNILVALLLGSLAAISGIHTAKKEVIETESTPLEDVKLEDYMTSTFTTNVRSDEKIPIPPE